MTSDIVWFSSSPTTYVVTSAVASSGVTGSVAGSTFVDNAEVLATVSPRGERSLVFDGDAGESEVRSSVTAASAIVCVSSARTGSARALSQL